MNLSIIELNDSEIRVANGTDIIVRSPGYALINQDEIVVGEAARKQAHLNPRVSNNRFWSSLNQDALAVSNKLARHNADLAYAHLCDLYEQAGKPDEIIFAVPDSYSDDQLALLLGLAEACEFTAVGLVDTAVAAASAVADNGQYMHINIHLHHTILTELEANDGIKRVNTRLLEGNGLIAIYDKCISYIADLFIHQSRFDPLHHAETEQALYTQLPKWLDALQTDNEVLLEVHYDGKRHQTKLLRQSLLNELQTLYAVITESLPATMTCLTSDRLRNPAGTG